jgi:succinoglycan biosynthesis transport protein ExoP
LRALSGDAKAVLVCLVPVSAELESTGLEPHSAGLADVVRGAASFGQVIRRDKQSRLHLVGYGWPDLGIDAILGSRRFTTMIEALAKAYDQVLIDAGGFDSGTLRLAAVAPRGVVIASQDSLKEAESASRMLIGAGFTDVAVMTAAPAATGEPQDLVAA